MLQILPLAPGPLVAERFLYLPMLGVAVVAARLVLVISGPGVAARRAWLVATLAAVLCLGTFTHLHSRVFASDAVLWAYERGVDRHRPYVLARLGLQALRAGQRGRALAIFHEGYRASVRDGRRDWQVRFVLYGVRATMAATARDDRARQRALSDFYEVLATEGRAELRLGGNDLLLHLDDFQRQVVDAEIDFFHVARAEAHARRGDLQRARQLLEQLCRDHPDSAVSWAAMAQVQVALSNEAAARTALARARAAAPNLHQVRAAALLVEGGPQRP